MLQSKYECKIGFHTILGTYVHTILQANSIQITNMLRLSYMSIAFLISSSIPNRLASFFTSKRNFSTNAKASLGLLHTNIFRRIFSFCCCTSCPNPTHKRLTVPHFCFGSQPSNCSRDSSGVLEFTHLRSLLISKTRSMCFGQEGEREKLIASTQYVTYNIRCICVSTPMPLQVPNAILSTMYAIFGPTPGRVIISSAVGGISPLYCEIIISAALFKNLVLLL